VSESIELAKIHGDAPLVRDDFTPWFSGGLRAAWRAIAAPMRVFRDREHEGAAHAAGKRAARGFTYARRFAMTASEDRVKCRLFWTSPTLAGRPRPPWRSRRRRVTLIR